MKKKKQDNHSNQINKQIIYSLIYFLYELLQCKTFISVSVSLSVLYFTNTIVSAPFILFIVCYFVEFQPCCQSCCYFYVNFTKRPGELDNQLAASQNELHYWGLEESVFSINKCSFRAALNVQEVTFCEDMNWTHTPLGVLKRWSFKVLCWMFQMSQGLQSTQNTKVDQTECLKNILPLY